MKNQLHTLFIFAIMGLPILGCSPSQGTTSEDGVNELQREGGVDPNEAANFKAPKAISEPLVTDLFTADPSAHVFEGKLYVYPSHDYEAGVPADDQGAHFAMKDYHVYSMEEAGGPVTDHGVALALEDIPWTKKQLWAPDAAFANGKYYLYFPAKDQEEVFRIGVAVGDRPEGPFKAQPTPIKGSYSIDPAVFKADDGTYYMYFGGIWGGQLQRWREGSYDPDGEEPANNKPALTPKVAKMNADMLSFAETPKDVQILDQDGNPLLKGDNKRRFFEAAWVHQYNGKYYFSYSTGDTHFIAYGIGNSPYGPFTYQGNILNPVIGWTNHHSIVEFNGKWYLFYHDSTLSNGKTHLRCMKMTELTYNEDGTIQTIEPYLE